jgi:hypothetical protein
VVSPSQSISGIKYAINPLFLLIFLIFRDFSLNILFLSNDVLRVKVQIVVVLTKLDVKMRI